MSDAVRRSSSRLFALGVLGGCLACTVLALCGAWSVGLDSANIVAPYWSGGGAVALLVLFISAVRRSSVQAVWVAIVLAIFTAAGAYILAPIASSGPAARGPGISLISFNMYKANPDPAAVARWLLRERADVVVLLEVHPRHHAALAPLRRFYPYVYDCSSQERCSTVIYSRTPAVAVRPWANGDADNRRALSAVTADFRIGDTVVPVTAVHLSRPWPLGDQTKDMAQLGQALAVFGRRGVLVGDFNSAPWTFAMRRLSGAAQLRLASGGGGTWPATFPPALRLPLDQLYVGPCLAADSVRLGPRLGSDHLPLMARISRGDCSG